MYCTSLCTNNTNLIQGNLFIRSVAHLIVLLIFVLIPRIGDAQGSKHLLIKADSLFSSHNLDSAIVLVELALGEIETEYGSNDTAVASVLRLASRYNYMAGRYDRAEKHCRQSLEIRQSQTEHDDFEIAKDLRSLGVILYQQAQYSAAESIYKQSLHLMEISLGLDHVEVARTIDNLALVYVDQGLLDEALPLHQRALAIKEAALGAEDSEIARSFNHLAAIYAKRGDYNQAEQLYRRALKIKEKVAGTDDLSLLSSLNNLANVLKLQARYSDAELLLRRALTICETQLGPEHQYVGKILNNLATTMSRQAHYAEAEDLYLRALAIVENNLGPDHPAVATVITSLSDLMRLTGRFHDAELLVTRSLKIRQAVLGPRHSDIASNLESLATLSRLQGNYADAEPLFNQAINMYKGIHGDNHPEVGDAMLGFANLKLNQGQYVDAETLYRQALQIYNYSFESDHPDIGLAIQNLANLLYKEHRDEEAEKLYRQALVISEAADGREHPRSALIMINLGLTLDRQGKLTEADSMMTKALGIRLRLQGPRHRDVGFSLNSLSRLRAHQGRFSEAESLLVEALPILTESIGPNHPEIANVEKYIAGLCVQAGKFNDALQHYEKSLQLKQRFLDYAFSFSSEGQKLRWLSKYPVIDNAVISLALLSSKQKAIDLAGKMILGGKAIVVDAMMAEKEAVICSDDPDLQEVARLRTEVGSRLANVALATVSEAFYQDYRDTLNNLIRLQDSIETELSRRCADFSRSNRQRQVSVADVAQALPEGSVLWEYVMYNPCDFDLIGSEKANDSPARYLGLVLSHSCGLSLLDLGPADQIDSLVYHTQRMISQAGAAILSSGGNHHERLLRRELKILYDRIFAPMIAVCDSISQIYVSPDGALNLLPLQVLPMIDESYVIEKYSITYLSSGRDILDMTDQGVGASGVALMVGDPDFDLADSSIEHSFNLKNNDLLRDMSLRPISPIAMCLVDIFPPLNYSRDEIRSSSTILRQAGISTHEYYGIDANERMLKNMTEPPGILHISTHGVFCEDTSDFTYSSIYNPLISNGLALAGINNTIGNQTAVDSNEEDGFLTALEVSDLNLMGTQLAVLAACETGSGLIVSGEGVFGLRRAFHHAGVQSLVMSLWRTPDKQTSQLISRFYEHWLNGMSRGEALRHAALEIINQSRSVRGSAHPLLWGGFVLIGNSN